MHILLKDNSTQELENGSTAKNLAEKLKLNGPDQALIVKINDEPKDLQTELSDGDRIEFFNFDDPIGKEVYWHTSAHVLAQAAMMSLYSRPMLGP